MADVDPFSQVYSALWTMLEAHSGFTGICRPANRIKLDGTSLKPTKEEIGDGDLPEVRLVPAGEQTPKPQRTSGTSAITLRFEIQVSTGEQRVDAAGNDGIGAAVFPVSWEVYRASLGWLTNLCALTWGGETFVIQGRLTNGSLGSYRQENSGIQGWYAIWTYEVECSFKTATIAPTA